jgi:4a-hydroxytetrahydrobiopterin dehydratase
MARDKTQLTQAELDTFLAQHKGWSVTNAQLERTFERPSFLEGIGFVQKIAALAEAQDHHPDIDIRWRKITLRLSTHDAGGLTWRDTKLAADIDAL